MDSAIMGLIYVILFVQRDRYFKEARSELQLLFDLRLADVELLALRIRSTGERGIVEVLRDESSTIVVFPKVLLCVGDYRPLLKARLLLAAALLPVRSFPPHSADFAAGRTISSLSGRACSL